MLDREQNNALQKLVESYVGEPDVRGMTVFFTGTLVPDDSKPEKPWVYLKVEKGIPASAYKALEHMGIPCEPRFDNPHVTVIKKDEVKKLIEVYGKDKWKDAVLAGSEEHLFTLREMVDLKPDGWAGMDRVWFIQIDCPTLSAKRVFLGLSPLPTGEDGSEQEFHITVAVRPAQGQIKEEMNRLAVLSALLD